MNKMKKERKNRKNCNERLIEGHKVLKKNNPVKSLMVVELEMFLLIYKFSKKETRDKANILM